MNKLAWLIALTPACITPSVVESSGRAVEAPAVELQWRAAVAADFDGLFESLSIEGEAAAALWRVAYHFARDGSFSGAALVIGGTHPEFQTLSGTWTATDGRIELGDGEWIDARAAEGHLRLESAGGIVILRRAVVQ